MDSVVRFVSLSMGVFNRYLFFGCNTQVRQKKKVNKKPTAAKEVVVIYPAHHLASEKMGSGHCGGHRSDESSDEASGS